MLILAMFSSNLRRAPLSPNLFKPTLQRLFATGSIEPIRKDSSDEYYDKELKKYDTLTNITKKTRQKQIQREPFVKNLMLGIYDKEILTFPELDLQEVKNVEADAEQLEKVLQQRHMVNIDSIGNKNFRQNLSDHKAIGLQASQFLDARECWPVETMRLLEALSVHQLRDSLVYHEMLGVQVLNKFANENLQKKYLHSLIKGERVCAFAMHEFQLTDVNKMKTNAVLSADQKYWTLNGTKTFVVNGVSADFIIVFAITETVTLQHGPEATITAFIVDKDTSGVSWKQTEPARIELAEITFENAQIPAENVLGQGRDGEQLLKVIISDFRLSCGPPCIAIMKQMMNNIYKTLVENSTAELQLLETESIISQLGEMATHLYAAESVTYLTAGLQDWYDGQDVEVESAIVKVVSSEAAYKMSSKCIDLVGMPAIFSDHWAHKAHEDVMNYLTLYESNESQRMFIAISGLQYAGVALSNTIKKIRNPFYFGPYNLMRQFREWRRYSDDPKLDLELFGHLHPSCKEPSKQLEYCVKRLEVVSETILTKYGLECVNKHVHLRRLADVIIDCYSMTAVLARASRSYCIGLQFADYEILLATSYCHAAMERVKANVNNIVDSDFKPNERCHIAYGNRLVESKGHFIAHPISRFF